MMQDWIARGKHVLAIEIEALQAVQEALDEQFAGAVAMLGACQGRVVVTGIGKSGLVGRKLAATFSSTGTPSFFLHPVEGAHGDLGAIRSGDVVIAISNSGKSDELNAIIPTLKSLGAKVIAITGKMDSPLALLSDVVISSRVPREACPLNLAPTSSTTATLALGDALAVCLIELKEFTATDFKRFHPAGALGQRLLLQVQDIMHTENLPVVQHMATGRDALLAMNKARLGAVIVVDASGAVAGIVTDGDVRRELARGTLQLEAPVTAIMTASPACARVGQNAGEAMDVMEQKSITVLPVVDAQDILSGVVHLHDLLGKGAVKFAG